MLTVPVLLLVVALVLTVTSLIRWYDGRLLTIAVLLVIIDLLAAAGGIHF